MTNVLSPTSETLAPTLFSRQKLKTRERKKCFNFKSRKTSAKLTFFVFTSISSKVYFCRDNISLASQHFLDKTGHTILDLFNNVLTEKKDIEQLIKENNVSEVSDSLPGLIIQGSAI